MKTVELTHIRDLELFPAAPFNFDATVHKPDHFPSGDNEWHPGARWQTMLWKGESIGLRLENRGEVDSPRVELSIWSERELPSSLVDELAAEIVFRYNLGLDLREFNRMHQADPQLGSVIAAWRGMRPMNCCSLYEYLIIPIVLQNATVRRSVAMMQSLFGHCGALLSYDGRKLFCFWQPGVMKHVSEQELRDLKVGYRAKSIKRVTEAFVNGEIDELDLRTKAPDEQRDVLLGLYGIGPASVGYILFDVFHRWDYLSQISLWEQRIYSKLFFDADPASPVPVKQIMDLLESRFGRYKMLAVHYVWEDLFWKRKRDSVPWLEGLIRL